jgi:hypothetical protein
MHDGEANEDQNDGSQGGGEEDQPYCHPGQVEPTHPAVEPHGEVRSTRRPVVEEESSTLAALSFQAY